MKDLVRSSRRVPPAHYILKIESFSQLVQMLSDTGKENYESEVFEAAGYKWKLSLYPNGHKEKNGEGYISLYLVLAETDSFNVGWDVKVNLRLFVFNHFDDTYTIFQDNNDDGDIRSFHESKTESGFAKLLLLSHFKDPSNGFLVRDKCAFGCEVFILNYSGRGECLTTLRKVEAIHTWEIDNFSSFVNDLYFSDEFVLGNRTWKIQMYPKGNKVAKGIYLSLFLELSDRLEKGKAYVNFTLRVKDQLHGKHMDYTAKCWLSKSATGWGWNQFLKLSDLYDASKGYLVKDTLIVEAVLKSISSAKKLPSN